MTIHIPNRIDQLQTLHTNKNAPLLLSDIPTQCLIQDHNDEKNENENEEITNTSSNLATGVVLGIDEAGRGPVLGPMTYGAVYWSLADDEKMVKHNFQDSKQMSKEARKLLFDRMIKVSELGYAVRVLHANEISGNMLRCQPYNLNAMSHDAAMQMISALLEQGVDLKKVYIDTVGLPDAYKAKLDRVFYGKGIEFVVEKKADSKFATCSAASILAKVLRDELTDEWVFSEGQSYEPVVKEYGSGYPSDPKCKKWMEQNSELDRYVI